MDHKTLKQLAEKVAQGKASSEESLYFMKEFNSMLEELKGELKK